ncbi:MAG TPA: ABC transporter ATP-binding protein [Kofleriaceae bacterium]|nr:ABC transporter ATP-binding protein [Kofleriaceae bacterium]
MKTTSPARRMTAILAPHAWPLVAASVLIAAAAGIGLVVPAIAGRVVDMAVIEHNLARLDTAVILLAVLFCISGAVTFGHAYLLRATGARLARRLRAATFSHIVSLGFPFFVGRNPGELVSRLGGDIDKLQATLTGRIPDGVRAVVTLAGALIIIFSVSTRLSVITLAVVPPIAAVAMLFGRRLERLATRIRDSEGQVAAVGEETIAGIATIKALGAEDRQRHRYRARLDALVGLQLHNAGVVGQFLGSLQVIGFGAFVVILWQGGVLVTTDALSPGDLTAFLIYASAIASSVGSLGGLYTGVREAFGQSARIFEILDTPATVTDAAGASALTEATTPPDIELAQVTFRYPGSDVDALSAVSLSVAAGETVALVGPSGGGKSTLLSLIARFYDPAAGTVFLGGRDVVGITLRSLRQTVAVVPQDVFLFRDSVAANIALGYPEAAREAIEDAARRAGASEFVAALGSGYDTVLGERGATLSAGQRQRIAIARALLCGAPVLLLDEATSALDAGADAAAWAALDAIGARATKVVIAHRLATARHADRIVVIDSGRVIDSGTHHELVSRCALYRHHWELQTTG